MNARSGRLFIVVFAAVACSLTVPLYAQSNPGGTTRYELASAIEAGRASFYWDAVRGSGQLVRGDVVVEFSPDDPLFLVNYQEVVAVEPPTVGPAGLTFGPRAWDLILRLFPPPPIQRRVGAIFIDPGHGGRDPGAIGRHRVGGELVELREKDVVLDASLALAERLRRQYPDKRIVLSRDTDVYLTLEERTERANAIEVAGDEAVVFVSVHANASLNPNAAGFEVWYLPSEYRRRDLVDPSRAGVADPSVLAILNTLREEEITIESILLARNILAGIDARVGSRSPNRGLKEESWYVVRNAKMPSVLVELGFLTNRAEFERLRDPAYLRLLVDGIYTGVVNFVRSFEELR